MKDKRKRKEFWTSCGRHAIRTRKTTRIQWSDPVVMKIKSTLIAASIPQPKTSKDPIRIISI